MSETLTLELNDDVYAAIRRQAVAVGSSPAQIAMASLEQQFSKMGDFSDNDGRTEVELQAARQRFEQHFGVVDLGYATGLDNNQIDADLAQAYAHKHKVG